MPQAVLLKDTKALLKTRKAVFFLNANRPLLFYCLARISLPIRKLLYPVYQHVMSASSTALSHSILLTLYQISNAILSYAKQRSSGGD